jgi:hypothetical protein
VASIVTGVPRFGVVATRRMCSSTRLPSEVTKGAIVNEIVSDTFAASKANGRPLVGTCGCAEPDELAFAMGSVAVWAAKMISSIFASRSNTMWLKIVVSAKGARADMFIPSDFANNRSFIAKVTKSTPPIDFESTAQGHRSHPPSITRDRLTTKGLASQLDTSGGSES